MSAINFGEIENLGKALGMLDGTGEFRSDWLTKPGDYMSSVLADETQRDALVQFVDDVLGGPSVAPDAEGLVWLQLATHTGPNVSVFLVLDPTPANYVGIGVGGKVNTASPASDVSVYVPIFRAAKSGHSVPDPLLIGKSDPAAFIHLDTSITIGTAPPLQGFGLSVRVPTAAGPAPKFIVTLKGLQLPGANHPTDFELSVTSLSDLEHAALQLVLGLARVEADALGAGPLSSVMGLLGLGATGAIPNLPLDQLLSQGAGVLSTWFESLMSNAASRTAWLTNVAALVGGSVSGESVVFNVGAGQISFAAPVSTGAGGHPIVTPQLGVNLTSGDIRLRAEADLVSLDLSNGSLRALPSLALYAQIGKRPDGGTQLLSGDPQLDCIRAGITLDASRKPVFLLAADNVVIAGHSYPTLDLSNPGAVAEAAGTIVADVVNSLIAGLGPIGTVIELLLGLTPPPSAPSATLLDIAALLHDPLAAVRAYWRGLLHDHPAAITDLISALRDLISDAAQGAVAISGTGTEADPWRLPLVGPVGFNFWRENGGDALVVALGAGYVADNLGQRCTRVATDIEVEIIRLDLAAGGAVFLPKVEATVSMRARGATQSYLGAGPFQVAADFIGLGLSWSPSAGIAFGVQAPNLKVVVDDTSIPVTLPTIGADGTLALDAAGWDALEPFIGLLASEARVPWIAHLVAVLGWSPGSSSAGGPHLRLADLVSNAAPAITGWLTQVALSETDVLVEALNALARVLTGALGSSGLRLGNGTPDSPYLVPLLPISGAPSLAVWMTPSGPALPSTTASDVLRAWRPGADGLIPAALSAAIQDELESAPQTADLVSGRPDLATGLALLATRWTGTDGRIAPPATDPAGITSTLIADTTLDQLRDAVGLSDLLGADPTTIVRIAVVASGAPLPWDNPPASNVIDLRGAARAPESFAVPTTSAGEWFIALAVRADARLASGDADGVAGQAARLARVLGSFSSLAAGLVIVAESEAGYPAIAAANSVAFIANVVTLGTPFGPVAFNILDDQPGADAFRLLRALLPPLDPNETDDPQRACGRGLVNALSALLPFGDPGREIRPPASAITPRAGLAVSAVFGVVSEQAVLAAMTAIVAAGISARASAYAMGGQPVTGARFGVRLPVNPAGSGVTVSGWGQLQLFSVDASGSGATVSSERWLALHMEVRKAGGWLVGGPGTGLGAGDRPPQSVRWMEFNLNLPFGAGTATADIVLHEAAVFGLERESWNVSPTLPEVRVLLSMVAEQITDPGAASPAVNGLIQLMQGASLLSSGGLTPDALDHLLNDPAAHFATAIANATQQSKISTGLTALLTGLNGVTVDLAGKRLVIDQSGTPGDLGMLPWTLHVEATAAGALNASASLGSGGTTAAGGAVLRLQTGPLSALLEWHRPGLATPELIHLWPSPDLVGLERALGQLLPAELTRLGLEYLRGLDATAKPIIDTALDSIGLLGAAVGSQRNVLLPAGLLHDPVSWFQHESSFGGPGGFSAPKVAALLDALKPIIGVTGDPGKWNLSNGVTAIADSDNGNLRLGLSLDTSAFAPIATAAGRLDATGTFTLTMPPGAAPHPGVSFSVGLSGAAPGRRAVYVSVNGSVSAFIRPATGADISLYPNPPGLAQLASAAVTQALPFILDHIASQTGATIQGKAGAIVSAIGDGLGLRTGSPAHFDGTKLQAWASDPAGSLVAALPTLTATAINAVATALQGVLPAGCTASVTSGVLNVLVGPVAVSWQPTPFQFGCTLNASGIPVLQAAKATIVLDTTGLKSLTAQLGPAAIDAGGVILRPLLAATVGESPAGGRRIQLGLAIDATGTKQVVGRWNIDGAGLALVSIDGATESTDPAQVVLTLLEALLDLVADYAIGTPALQQLLNNAVGATTVRELMRGVILQDVPSPAHLDANLFDPSRLLERVQKLAINLAHTSPSISIGGGLTIGLGLSGPILQLTLGVNGRIPLNSGDVVVSVEADSRWIEGQPQAGIAVGVLDTATMTIKPSLAANGIGLRISKSSGPLLNAGLSLGSVAVHLYGAVDPTGAVSGGVQLQLSDVSAALSGAQGGNTVAQGLMGDGGSGQDRLAPAFSPALAVQKHSGGPVMVSLSAGDGSGPWWLVIQKGFGPIYIEQVGFGVTVQQSQIQSISLLLDGRVSLFGLTAEVDELQLTFVVASNASLFDPSRWAIDLGGLAIAADMAGVTLIGGLRKFGDGDNVEYVGMLLGRFAAYGLSVYGGYGSAVVNGSRFSAFFAFGAVNGPIGGPPAFFLTGIGGGLGINRDLIFPSDFSNFGTFPFLQALDPSSPPNPDPMAELAQLRTDFPMKRGEFWFAAGISFLSFALVEGIAVLSVKIGDGLEIALIGLARMALPRPEFALVSIELGLLVRFSTEEGVMWIQAQLTDNSWLLSTDVRLTGGFAFVTWYKGPNAGQFVLTLGGYHPSFHHDGYPQVPRLGFNWSISDAICIKGESYFALTSEAVMAGGKLTASAHFGPAWAVVIFGADGIVYFDPFRFEVEVYASISAGVTIDVWIGEITISISLGARIMVAGPKFHGRAEFDIGPISLAVEFGDSSQSAKVYLTWDQFVTKYLEEASPGVARVLTAIPGKGAVPPGTKAGGTSETGTADGSVEKPFEVFAEFEITVTTTVPTQLLNVGGADTHFAPSHILGISPVNVNAANTRMIWKLVDSGASDHLPALLQDPHTDGSFPLGVWGPPQPDDDKKIPSGDVVQALDSVRFEAVASLQGTLPKAVRYNQVEIGPRRPLPFPAVAAYRPGFLGEANALSALLPVANTGPATFAIAKPWLALGGHSNTAVRAVERERSAPPRLGSLTQDLATQELEKAPIALTSAKPPSPVDHRVHPPVAIAILSPAILAETPAVKTTVSGNANAVRVAAPTLKGVQAMFSLAVPAKLLRVPGPAVAQGNTLLSAGAVPLTRVARSNAAAVGSRGAPVDAANRLKSMTAGFGVATSTLAQKDTAPPEPLRAGEIAVLQLPNAKRDAIAQAPRPMLAVQGSARVVAFAHGGNVLWDGPGSANGTQVPQGTERIAVLALGDSSAPPSGFAGWHSRQELPYTGWSCALAAGAVVYGEGGTVAKTKARFRAGWARATELVNGTTIVETRFTGFASAVMILIDDPVNSDAERGLSLTLEGAQRAGTAAVPVSPTVVVIGNRSILIYSIVMTPSPNGVVGPFTVSVMSQDGWHLAGVMAGNDSPESIAAKMAATGPDRLLQPLTASRTGSVTIHWIPPVPTDPTGKG
jgi:hypothetical protein